jgi:hypothetical protein
MKISVFFFFTALFLLLSLNSCKENKVPVAKKKVMIDPNGQSEFDNLVSAIDASLATDSSKSLRFENDEFTRKQLLLYRYENISCTKWIFEEDGKNGEQKTTHFYFNKGKLIHSKKITFEDDLVYETKSYYNEKMQGIFSSNRTSSSFLELDKAALKPCDFVTHNFKECLNIKDTEGLFETKFIELINFEGVDFMRVGNKENSGYWTDIIVPEMNDSIKQLEKLKTKNKLNIVFKTKNINGFDYQVLESFSY